MNIINILMLFRMIKKLLILAVTLLSCISAFADDPGPTIVIPPDGNGSGNKGNGPQNLTDIPRVWYDFGGGYFIVAIQSMETTTLKVENSSGATVVQTTVNTDGYSHSYPVTPLPTGIYLVTLENVEESHSGYLLIP